MGIAFIEFVQALKPHSSVFSVLFIELYEQFRGGPIKGIRLPWSVLDYIDLYAKKSSIKRYREQNSNMK